MLVLCSFDFAVVFPVVFNETHTHTHTYIFDRKIQSTFKNENFVHIFNLECGNIFNKINFNTAFMQRVEQQIYMTGSWFHGRDHVHDGRPLYCGDFGCSSPTLYTE